MGCLVDVEFFSWRLVCWLGMCGCFRSSTSMDCRSRRSKSVRLESLRCLNRIDRLCYRIRLWNRKRGSPRCRHSCCQRCLGPISSHTGIDHFHRCFGLGHTRIRWFLICISRCILRILRCTGLHVVLGHISGSLCRLCI